VAREQIDWCHMCNKRDRRVDVTDGLAAAGTTSKIRRKRAKVVVTDGPFAETKELVGGSGPIETRDKMPRSNLDEVLEEIPAEN